ncbi:MAG: hypothetical protein WAN10_05820 [Candidatus Acidiferrales bacterium]
MKDQPTSASHPWLIGIAVGVVILVAAIVSATRFPDAPEPVTGMTIAGGALALGMITATYWRFLRSWRLWISLGCVITLDAICIRVFLEQVRNLTLWDIDLIVAFELFATMLFLNWFLDTKKARLEISRGKE